MISFCNKFDGLKSEELKNWRFGLLLQSQKDWLKIVDKLTYGRSWSIAWRIYRNII